MKDRDTKDTPSSKKKTKRKKEKTEATKSKTPPGRHPRASRSLYWASGELPEVATSHPHYRHSSRTHHYHPGNSREGEYTLVRLLSFSHTNRIYLFHYFFTDIRWFALLNHAKRADTMFWCRRGSVTGTVAAHIASYGQASDRNVLNHHFYQRW